MLRVWTAPRPIGVFDSGVGGLTVARALLDQLPGEELLYVGDTAHGPYGPLPIAEVRRHALAVCDRLVDEGVKLLVIACNTASAACLRDARERYDVPVVEVVQPAVRRAVAATRTGRVGVIGTVGTITSGAYDDAFAAAPHVDAHQRRLPGLRRLRRARRDHRPAAAAARHALPRARARGRRRRPRARVHPLPAADGHALARGGRRRDAGQQRGGDGQGRLPGARVAPTCCASRPTPPRHRFEATGDPEPFARLARRFLGPVLAGRVAVA